MAYSSPFNLDFDIPLTCKDVVIRTKDIRHISMPEKPKPIYLPNLGYIYTILYIYK